MSLSQKWHLIWAIGRGPSMDAHKGHHTDCVVLSAANRAAFQGYVYDLLEAGRRDAAEAAWSSVFEVVHRPWMGPMVELPPLRPIRLVPCTSPTTVLVALLGPPIAPLPISYWFHQPPWGNKHCSPKLLAKDSNRPAILLWPRSQMSQAKPTHHWFTIWTPQLWRLTWWCLPRGWFRYTI